MYYIGLDISMTATGLVVLNEKKEAVLETCIKSKPQRDWFARMRGIITQLQQEHKKYMPAIYFVEGYAFGAHGKVFDIAELSGTIKYHIAQIWTPSCTIIQIPPTALKKFITGKGNAPKDMMLKEVYKKYGKDYDNDNIADAYGLAFMGHTMCHIDMDKVPEYQKTAIDGVLTNNKLTFAGYRELVSTK